MQETPNVNVDDRDATLRRSQRIHRPAISSDYIVYLQEHEFDVGDTSDLSTYQEAITSSQSTLWINVMKDETSSISENEVWDLVDLPDDCRPIGYKWVFKTKHDSRGQVERYKVRLVAKSYSQREGIYYKETLSPISTKDFFRVIMEFVAHFDLELHQMDMRIAFLNGDLSENVYMVQPPGFEVAKKENMVCKL